MVFPPGSKGSDAARESKSGVMPNSNYPARQSLLSLYARDKKSNLCTQPHDSVHGRGRINLKNADEF